MRRCVTFVALLIGAFALVVPLPAVAQYANGGPAADGASAPVIIPPPGQQAPGSFGPMGGFTAFQAARWLPWLATPNPTYYSLTGYVGPTDTNGAHYWTQLDLPNGASIDYVYAVLYDNDATGSWYFDFHGYEGAPFNGSPDYVSFVAGSTSGTPGYTAIQLYPSPDVVIHEWADISGDGLQNVVSYNLSLEGTQTGSSTLRFWGAVVHWTRTISPAPASATFPDVAPGFWAFQEIEALVDSGITTGFPDGTYRPTDPVTRAQMATFLARALGLHWGI